MNPQRTAFKELYCNPESDTFGNAQQSAIKAGFSKEYAKNIMNQGQDWVLEIIRDTEMTSKAEKVLNEMLEMDVETITMRTKNGDVIDRNPALIKIKQDTAKFITERLKKEKWSNRTELTGKDGEQLVPLEGFNYVKPKDTDNPATTEATPSVADTSGQSN